jgi:hypothetical protein
LAVLSDCRSAKQSWSGMTFPDRTYSDRQCWSVKTFPDQLLVVETSFPHQHVGWGSSAVV